MVAQRFDQSVKAPEAQQIAHLAYVLARRQYVQNLKWLADRLDRVELALQYIRQALFAIYRQIAMQAGAAHVGIDHERLQASLRIKIGEVRAEHRLALPRHRRRHEHDL